MNSWALDLDDFVSNSPTGFASLFMLAHGFIIVISNDLHLNLISDIKHPLSV